MSAKDRQTIIVTGGAGYIGSHVCKELFRNGYLPVAYDSMVNGNTWAVKWGPLEVGDIKDKTRLGAVMENYHPLGVIHLAAYAYVGESVCDPAKYYLNNVGGTLSLLESMREHGITRTVFSSSCAVYGLPTSVPIGETQRSDPINPYGSTKMIVERILREYHGAYSLSSISLRYFNAAGADPDSEVGEWHVPETHLIPLCFDAAMGIVGSVSVYGDQYPTEDGTCVRDYTHVSDLARAHVLALQALEGASAARAYNLGVGRGYSVKQVLLAVERVTGRKIPHTIAGPRAGDPPVLVADPAKAEEQLKWKARYSDLERIVADAWRFRQIMPLTIPGGGR
jgi:UDP-arabinose 4-epimerase